jgi:hypothetical protein
MTTPNPTVTTAELERRYGLSRQIASVFTPARPVTQDTLFAGRVDQIRRLVDSLETPGQHAVLFGEQGVGKTSLGQFVHRRWDPSIYVVCSATDDFDSVFRRMASEITVRVQNRGVVGFHAAAAPTYQQIPLTKLISKAALAVPDCVALLSAVTEMVGSLTIFLDEFDRIPDACRQGFSELLKVLSDSAIDCTFVLIGIADDMRTLVADHQSVERNIRQIRIPRMSFGELDQIILKGCGQIGLSISEPARRSIIRTSHGLPYFTHLISLETLKTAALEGRLSAGSPDVHAALTRALSAADASLTTQLHDAINGTNQEYYMSVLRAASICERNSYGSFTLANVRVTHKREFEQSAKEVNSAIQAFCRLGRGPVLLTSGSRTNRLLRFRSPLFEAYVDLHWQVEKIAGRSRPA